MQTHFKNQAYGGSYSFFNVISCESTSFRKYYLALKLYVEVYKKNFHYEKHYNFEKHSRYNFKNMIQQFKSKFGCYIYINFEFVYFHLTEK